MKRSKKIIVIICSCLVVAYSLFVVVCSKWRDLGRHFIYHVSYPQPPDGFDYGDLYKERRTRGFDFLYPKFPLEGLSPTAEAAEILLIGDSFLYNDLGSPAYADLLNKHTKGKVYLIDKTQRHPYLFLEKYKKGRKKIMIWEGIDGNAIINIKLNTPEPQPDTVPIIESPSIQPSGPAAVDRVSVNGKEKSAEFLTKAWTLIQVPFNNEDIDWFFTSNRWMVHLNTFLTNFKNETGIAYKARYMKCTDPPFLFDWIDFNLQEISDDQINHYAVRFQSVREHLKPFNIDLVIALIPNKLAVYADCLDVELPNNNFIPRLQAKLKEYGVPYIDVYSAYQKYRAEDDREKLFLESDMHYGKKGREIFFDESVKYLESSHAARP